jgi:hypothetical protein
LYSCIQAGETASAAAAAILTTLDTDGDGRVSLREFERGMSEWLSDAGGHGGKRVRAEDAVPSRSRVHAKVRKLLLQFADPPVPPADVHGARLALYNESVSVSVGTSEARETAMMEIGEAPRARAKFVTAADGAAAAEELLQMDVARHIAELDARVSAGAHACVTLVWPLDFFDFLPLSH